MFTPLDGLLLRVAHEPNRCLGGAIEMITLVRSDYVALSENPYQTKVVVTFKLRGQLSKQYIDTKTVGLPYIFLKELGNGGADL